MCPSAPDSLCDVSAVGKGDLGTPVSGVCPPPLSPPPCPAGTLPGSSATKCGTSISVAAMCRGGISIAPLSAGASDRATPALESSSALLSGANPPPLAGEGLTSPTPDIMDSTRVPFSSRLLRRYRHMQKTIALIAMATAIPPTPLTMPMMVPTRIPPSVVEAGSSFWAAVLLEDDDGVGESILLPEAAVLCTDDGVAVAVEGAEYVDPGAVGSVARMLRSDSCQRTWRAKASSEPSVVWTHLE